MDISLIICTWNNQKILKKTLESLCYCEIPENLSWECIVVNNNSTDDTEELILFFKDKLPIKYIFEPIQGLSRGRNAGLKAAVGKLIIFADDDIEPCQEWIKSYWEAYQRNPFGYYWGGPIESNYEKGTLDPELVPLAPGSVKGFNLGDKMVVKPNHGYFLGTNWACPVEIIRASGNFDVNRGLDPSSGRIKVGEETYLMVKLIESGWKACYLPEARIKHFVPLKKMTFEHIVSRWEAAAFEHADEYVRHLKDSLIYGVPRWMVKKAFLKWLKYFYLRMSGQKWRQAYISYREDVGILKGLKEIQKAKNQ